MSTDVGGGTFTPIFQQRLVSGTFIQKTDVERMVAQLMSHPAVAETDGHVQHRHDAVHHAFAIVIQKAEPCVGDKPEVIGLHQFLENVLIIVLDGANARCFEPALVATHTMRNVHVGGVDDFNLFVRKQSDNRFFVNACS